MSKRCLAVLFTTVFGFAVSHAAAEPITAGALVWPEGRVTLASGDFTFDGRVSVAGGVFKPWDCTMPVCVPGGTVDLFAHWSGLDLPGTATLGDEVFRSVGSAASSSSLTATWAGTLFIPEDFAGGVLTAPFEFFGAFRYIDGLGTGQMLDLSGAGIATATLVPHFTAGAYSVEAISYDFDAAATPEPATLLLLGTGFIAVAARRHWKNVR